MKTITKAGIYDCIPKEGKPKYFKHLSDRELNKLLFKVLNRKGGK
jgi:hypothetical protein